MVQSSDSIKIGLNLHTTTNPTENDVNPMALRNDANATALKIDVNLTTVLPIIVLERGAASILSIFVNVPALIAYGMVCYVFLKHRKQFSNPFYTLALSLAVPDSVTGVLELVYCIPSRLIGDERIDYHYQSVIGFLSVGSYFMLTSHMMVISVNRLVAVVFYTRYAALFSAKRTILLIALCYAYGVAIVTMMYACRCRLVFPGYAWLFDCHFDTCANAALMVNQIVSNGAVVFIGLCYIIIFFQVRRTSRKIKSSNESNENQVKKELKLMIQFSAISSALLAYEATFWIIPPLIDSGRLSATSGAILINLFCNLNSCVSPFLYLAFCSEIRQKLICCGGGGGGKSTENITQISVTKSGIGVRNKKIDDLKI